MAFKSKYYIEFDINGVQDIIQFCCSSSYFKFNGNYFMQTEGMAMGNLISHALANLIMSDLIEYIFKYH